MILIPAGQIKIKNKITIKSGNKVRHQIPVPRRTREVVRCREAANLSRGPGAFVALRTPRHKLGDDDQSAEGVARGVGQAFLAASSRTRPQTGFARYHPEIPLAVGGSFVDRERAYSGQP